MKYIEEHYFHYRAAEQTEILGKGRKSLGKAEEHLDWVDELPNINKTKITTVATNRRRSAAKQTKAVNAEEMTEFDYGRKGSRKKEERSY